MKTQNLKFLALTVLLSVAGVMNSFALELIGSTFFSNNVQYRIISIQQDAKTGKVAVHGNNLAVTTTSLRIDGTVTTDVEGTVAPGTQVYKEKVTFTVTEIDKEAFDKLGALTTLEIPASVETIYEGAFNNCGELATVTIGYDGTSQLTTVGDYVFGNTNVTSLDLSNCPKLNLSTGKPFVSKATGVNRQLKEVTLPAAIKNIGTAFANCEVLETLDLTGTHVFTLDAGALKNTKALKKVEIPCATDATVTTCKVGKNAFEGSGIEELIIDGYIANSGDFQAQAGAVALKKVTFNGNLGANALPAYAFPNSPLTTVIVNGELFGQNAIGQNAFANKAKLTDIELNGNLNATGAVAPNAFAGAGTTAALTTLTVGTIKQPAAIAAGAFSGADLDVVNFNDLLATGAIAKNQFSTALYVGTVNFNKDIETVNVIGENAFTGANVWTVNFNGDVNVANAVTASASEMSPFADEVNTFNFNGDVVSGGFGPYAFSESEAKVINLSNTAVFGVKAFATGAFNGIPAANINYNPAVTLVNGVTFDIEDFISTSEWDGTQDIRFLTNNYVKNQYVQVPAPADWTPNRIKFIINLEIETTAGPNGRYYGAFKPQNEQYIIEKYQNGNTVTVYSAYYDDKTINYNDRTKGDIYMNPLRVQDNGKYVINEGHTVIVVSSGAQKVIAQQDEVGYWGGVQLFGGLNAEQCNDLRYSPWLFNKAAYENGEEDSYGNVVSDYVPFRVVDFATYGYAMASAKSLPEGSVYVLATNKQALRESYSGKAEMANTHAKAIADLIAALQAAQEAAEAAAQEAYNQGYADALDNWDDIAEKWAEKIAQIEAAAKELGAEEHYTGADVEKEAEIEELYAALIAALEQQKANLEALCEAKRDLAVAQDDLEEADADMSCITENTGLDEKYAAEETWSALIEAINGDIENLEEAATEPQFNDDLYYQFLSRIGTTKTVVTEAATDEAKALAAAYVAYEEAKAAYESDEDYAEYSALTPPAFTYFNDGAHATLKEKQDAYVSARATLGALVGWTQGPENYYDDSAYSEEAAAAAKAAAEDKTEEVEIDEAASYAIWGEDVNAEGIEDDSDEKANFVAYGAYMTARDQKEALEALLAELQELDCYKAYAAAGEAVNEKQTAVDEALATVTSYNDETVVPAEEALVAAIETIGKEEEDESMASGARLNVIWNDGSEGEVTGIMNAVVSNGSKAVDSDAIYNLQGIRMGNKAQKGVYIQNGKKVIK